MKTIELKVEQGVLVVACFEIQQGLTDPVKHAIMLVASNEDGVNVIQVPGCFREDTMQLVQSTEWVYDLSDIVFETRADGHVEISDTVDLLKDNGVYHQIESNIGVNVLIIPQDVKVELPPAWDEVDEQEAFARLWDFI